MNLLFKFFPVLAPYALFVKIAAIAIAAAAVAGAWATFIHHERDIGRAEVRQAWDGEKRVQLAAAAAEAQVNAKETQRRLERQKESQDGHDQEVTQARAAAAAASDAAGRMRRHAEQLAAAARGSCSNSTARGDGKATEDPAGVLAELLGRVVERSRRLAEYGDAARIAGAQCERDYDALILARPRRE
jgi:hypothetical protein